MPKYYPATGEVIGEVEIATSAMIDAAVAAASDAQRQWASARDRARPDMMAQPMHCVQPRRAVALEVEDVGKVYAEAASADVPSGPTLWNIWRGGDDHTGTHHQWPDGMGYTRRVPLGVCAGIGAWNYPAQIAL